MSLKKTVSCLDVSTLNTRERSRKGVKLDYSNMRKNALLRTFNLIINNSGGGGNNSLFYLKLAQHTTVKCTVNFTLNPTVRIIVTACTALSFIPAKPIKPYTSTTMTTKDNTYRNLKKWFKVKG